MSPPLRQAQQQVETERERLFSVLNMLPGYVCVLTADHDVRFVNARFVELFGDPQGKKCYDALFQRDTPCGVCHSFDCLQSGQPEVWEWVSPLGTTYEIHDYPMEDIDGVTVVLEFGLDISARKQTEAELQHYQVHLEELVDERTHELEETAEQLAAQTAFSEAILDTTANLIMVLDTEGRIVRFNRACEELTGYTVEEVRGRPFWEFLLLPDEAEQVMNKWSELVNLMANRNENHWVTRDGERRLIAFNNSVLSGPDGKVAYVISAGVDVTARRRLEQLVREANAYHRALIEASPDPLVTISADGRITDVNSATERVTGLPRDQLVGTDFADYFTDPELARGGYEQVFRDGQVADYPLEIVGQDGRITPVLYNAAVYRDEADQVAGVFAAARDVSRQREMEEALRASEAKYRDLINKANVVVLSLDSQGRFTFLNPYGQRFFGYTEEELVGRNVLGTIVPTTDSEGRDMGALIPEITGDPDSHAYNENENLTKDGRRVWMSWSNQTLFDEHGEMMGLLAIGVDRTAQRRAEEMLTNYRESLRSLASELALAEERERRRIAVGIHDHVSQTLALVKMRLGSLHRSSLGLAWDEPLDEVEGLVDQVIGETRSLTFELSPPILYELGLGAALEWVCERTTERHSLPCYFEGTGDRFPLAEEVRVVLFQGARELVTNVVKHAQASQTQLRVWRDEANLYVQVEDDGIGFDVTHLPSAVGATQSFGLFNVRERLQYLGGRAEVESTPGHGTRVTLIAPLQEDN